MRVEYSAGNRCAQCISNCHEQKQKDKKDSNCSRQQKWGQIAELCQILWSDCDRQKGKT